MNSIITLIYRDFLELKNKPRNLLLVLIAVSFPLVGFFSNDGVIGNKQILILLLIIVSPIYISMESTLGQTARYIKDGIYEQYFLNRNIKKYQIVLAKWVVNSVLSLTSCVLSLVIYFGLKRMSIINLDFSFNVMLFVYVIIISYVSTAIGILAATIIKNERSYYLYCLLMIAILLIIFKIFDIFTFFSNTILVIYLVIVCIVSTILINLMYTSNRFVNRDK